MKMKMKMTLVAGALALAVAGQANATIVDMNSGSSNLVLSVWDTVNNVSYTRDLGVNMSTFAATVSGTTVATLAAGTPGNMTFTADALLTSWMVGNNNLVWNVIAGDKTGTATGINQQRFLTTGVGAPAMANSQLTGGGTSLQTYFAASSTATGAGTSAVSNPVSGAAAPYAGTTFTVINGGGGNAAWGAGGFTTTAAIGSSMDFWYLTPAGGSTVTSAAEAMFQNAAGASTWTLASNGTLTYTVAAVPEPGEWLLMLSGLGLIGFIATRRRNNAGSMTFA
ncbi:MAG: PEP-CTERM sorting domain-containing protein [Gammaproteobacteria bacterium]|nr:PEP-CTERM sorting domain-containing protein [Gammaproteobacteria bacterium]MBU1481761.1 PEP-CTERM sorting domain-containing protein [Gammaproteobacteria bacterium]